MERRLVPRRAAEEDVAEQLGYIAADRPAVARHYAMAPEDAYERRRSGKKVSFRSRARIQRSTTCTVTSTLARELTGKPRRATG